MGWVSQRIFKTLRMLTEAERSGDLATGSRRRSVEFEGRGDGTPLLSSFQGYVPSTFSKSSRLSSTAVGWDAGTSVAPCWWTAGCATAVKLVVVTRAKFQQELELNLS